MMKVQQKIHSFFRWGIVAMFYEGNAKAAASLMTQ